jgi:hypothetical protein
MSVIHLSVVGAHKKADGGDTAYTITFKVVGIDQVADPSQLYLLEIRTEDATDDDISIGVNSKGLLSSVSATSTDESGAILKKIAETAATTIQTLGVVAPAAGNACKDLQDFSIDWSAPYTGGPVDTASLEQSVYEAMTPAPTVAKNTGNAIKFSLTLDPLQQQAFKDAKGDGVKPVDGFRPSSEKFPKPVHPAASAPGLRFRMPELATLSAKMDASAYEGTGNCKLDGVANQEVRGQQVLLMDPDHDYVFNMQRSILVKTSIKMTVTDGVLTSAEINRDSPALAVVSLPLDLISILLSPIETLIHGKPATAGTKAGG